MAFRLAPTALVASLYVAYFNRAVESAGLTYWHNQYRAELAKSGNEDDTSAQLSAWIYQGGQDEAALAEPISDAEFIANIYENLLGRGRPALEGVDRDGFNFWLDKLENGHVSRAEFAAAFISGISAVNDPEGAAKFALVLKTALTWARSDASQGLDDAALRAAGIKALQDALYPPEPQPEPEPEPQPEPQPQPQPEPEPEPDGPIQLVHGDISVLGTPGDDVFVGTVDGSLSFLDTLILLDGLEGHDRLEITDTVTANTTFWLNNNLMLQDIEELSITTERAFLSLDGLGDLARFGDLTLFELISRGNAVAEVSVAAATDVSIDTANYQFSLYGGHGSSTFGSAQVTTRGTNNLTIVERHDVTIDDVSVGNSLVSVGLEDVGGTIVLNTLGLTNLSLFDVEARAEVSVNVSGNESIGISLNGVGVTDLVDLSVAASDPLATGEISLVSNGTSQNILALTSAPGMSLFIGGAGALALSWHADAPAGVAAINAGTASGGVFVDLTLSGFNSVNATFGSGNDHILLDLHGSVDGGAGNDTFSVRATGVTLTGGAGNDNFDLREVSRDGGASFPGMITITDFEAGDQIQLATPLSTGNPLVSSYLLAFPGESLEDIIERQVPPAPNSLMLYQIDGSDVSNGFYLLAQDGNPVIDGNDLLIRLDGINANDRFTLNNGVLEFFIE